MKTGAKTDKIEKCHLELAEASTIKAPLLAQCPVSLECKVCEVRHLGTHTMFLADITAVQAEERYIDSKGKFNLQQAGLLSYAHGEYFVLGRNCGDFGFSVRRRKKHV